jgi:hypothetical protein
MVESIEMEVLHMENSYILSYQCHMFIIYIRHLIL